MTAPSILPVQLAISTPISGFCRKPRTTRCALANISVHLCRFGRAPRLPVARDRGEGVERGRRRGGGKHPGFKRNHGIAIATEFGRGFVTDGADGNFAIFDLKTLKVTGGVKTAPDADGVIYDPATKHVFVMSGEAKAATVIDAKAGTVIKTVDLGGGPEFVVSDGKGMVYINLEDKAETVALDARTFEIKSRYPVAPASGPPAIAIDRSTVGCLSPGEIRK